MSASVQLSALTDARRTPADRAQPPALCPSVVPATLGLAVSLAVSADALLRDGLGAAFPAWIAMTAVSLVVLTWRAGRALPRETAGWLVAAALFSCGLAWRDSDALQTFDFLATVGALVQKVNSRL